MISLFFSSWIDYIIHGILIIGIIGTFGGAIVSKIPLISQYGTLVKGVSIIALIAGVFFEGYNFAMADYRAKVKEFEDKVKVAEEQSKKVNTEIKTVYVDRVKSVKETQYIIQEKIKEVEKKIDAECKVAPEAVQLLNQASITPKKEAKK